MATSTEGFNFVSLLPIALIFVVMYFLLIRPQQKRAKQHQEMLKTIKRGDKILTSGGIIGTVSKVVTDQELQVEIAPGTQVRIMRSMVSDILSRTSGAGETVATPSSEKNPEEKVQKLISRSKSKKK